jgi:hypothetical protein
MFETINRLGNSQFPFVESPVIIIESLNLKE